MSPCVMLYLYMQMVTQNFLVFEWILSHVYTHNTHTIPYQAAKLLALLHSMWLAAPHTIYVFLSPSLSLPLAHMHTCTHAHVHACTQGGPVPSLSSLKCWVSQWKEGGVHAHSKYLMKYTTAQSYG